MSHACTPDASCTARLDRLHPSTIYRPVTYLKKTSDRGSRIELPQEALPTAVYFASRRRQHA